MGCVPTPCPPCRTTAFCCRIGERVVALTDEATYTVNLANPRYANSRYDMVRFTGGAEEVTPVATLPGVTRYDDAYEITIENRLLSDVVLKASTTDGTDAQVTVEHFKDEECSLEDEIVDGAVNSATYRTRVKVTVEGVYRVPGFSRTSGG